MAKIYTAIIILCSTVGAWSQNKVKGTFAQLANTEVKLIGYNGFTTYLIDKAQASETGKFSLSFAEKDYGMGYILAENDNSFIILLAQDENLLLKGESLATPSSISIINGAQNQLFEQYAGEQARRAQTLSAWEFLSNIYKNDRLFSVHENPRRAIESEKRRIKLEDSLFLADLPEGSYLNYYLPLRKLTSSVGSIAQFHTEEIPATLASFRNIDYTDSRLYKSGLVESTIESQYWLIENSGRSLDSVYAEMNKSTGILVENLLSYEDKLNEVTEYLFQFLEKRSLFEASAYLAVRLLNEQSCRINKDFAAQLESYRSMKVGNTAPEIQFNGSVFSPGYNLSNLPKKLSDIKSSYVVVFFGAGWCPQCSKEIDLLKNLYSKWEQQNIEILLVSLDVNKESFSNFVKTLPFISYCDYQKWEGEAVTDYHVFATPTMYLLNQEKEILLRPNSVKHLDAWIDWNLIEEKK